MSGKVEKLHFQLHFPGSPWEAKVKERRPIQLEYHNQIFTTIEWVDDAKEGGGRGGGESEKGGRRKAGGDDTNKRWGEREGGGKKEIKMEREGKIIIIFLL